MNVEKPPLQIDLDIDMEKPIKSSVPFHLNACILCNLLPEVISPHPTSSVTFEERQAAKSPLYLSIR